ncbi:MAG: DNA cytosine methyltransferase [Eubacteriaceae bacterium]|nr:DNA cytosine methyltransferase [Eubacteriaceae bacterium]
MALQDNNHQYNRIFTAASLFCGAGGLDMGFEQAGFNALWANDNDKNSCETHKGWSNANVVCCDVAKIDPGQIPDTDIILGGFPCQGFSLSGPRKVDDSRNRLYKEYVRLVNAKRPAAFIGENVKGLLSLANGAFLEAIVDEFSGCGYNVFFQAVNARDFAVPQDRQRVIITGFRKDLKISSFTIPSLERDLVDLSDALKALGEPAEDEICTEPFSSRYMSRNRKRRWNQVSFTIPAMAKQVTLHPSSPDMVKLSRDEWVFGEDSPTRRLSYRECAAIQTFPPDMEFVGNLASKYKQIGNAVPVALARNIAYAVRKELETKI